MGEPVDDGDEMERSVVDDQAGTPRWVKVSVFIIAAVVVLLVLVLLYGGNHGPGRHSAPQGSRHTPPAAEYP